MKKNNSTLPIQNKSFKVITQNMLANHISKINYSFFKTLTLTGIVATSIFTFSAQANDQTFDSFVFFGDSLSDSGYYTNYLETLGKFTTNPDKVWTEVFAELYGSEAIANSNKVKGNNYAAGGALSYVSKPDDELRNLGIATVPMPSVNTQIKNYLADNTIKQDTLYSVWIGANDMLSVSEMNPTPNAIEAAGLMGRTAATTAKSIQELSDKGANYILVPNIPDVGLSPNAILSGNSSESSALANFHNRSLYNNLSAGTANVIPLDTFSLLQEVVKNPVEYGFNKIPLDVKKQTACGFDSSSGTFNSSLFCNKNSDGYIFADGVHPTGAVHDVIAKYSRSVIEAPNKYAQISNKIKQSSMSENLQIHRRLNQLKTNQNNVWVEGGISSSDGKEYTNDDVSSNLVVGADFGMKSSNTGMYIRTGQDDIKIDDTTGFELDQSGFGVYHSHDIKDYNLSLYGGIDKYDISWERGVKLGTNDRVHTAEGGARKDYIGLKVQRQININKLNNMSLTPYFGGLSQNVTLNSLYESSPEESTSMVFNKFKQKNLIGEFGIQASYPVNNKLNVTANAKYNHEFKQSDTQVTSNLRSVSSSYTKGFSLPVRINEAETLAFSVGVDGDINDKVKFQVGVAAEGNDSDNVNTSVYIGMNTKF